MKHLRGFNENAQVDIDDIYDKVMQEVKDELLFLVQDSGYYLTVRRYTISDKKTP